MSQPKWKLIGNNGDASPFEHGGELVFKDLTGKYDPELMIIEPLDEHTIDGKPATFTGRFPIPKPDLDDWFMEDLDLVASFIGSTKEDLSNMLMSDDLLARAMAYKSLYDYWGSSNFVDYWDLELISDLKKRYGRLKNI